MDKKTAQHIAMVRDYGLMKLLDKQFRLAVHETFLYESAHGYGIADEYDEAEYERWVQSDEGFKEVFAEECKALDEYQEARDRFCRSMERFSDGQISFDTARKMVANPRLAEKLEAIMMGEKK